MSSQSFDTAIQDGTVIILFHFTYNGLDYRYTSISQDFEILGHTWVSAPFKLASTIKTSGEFPKNKVGIEMPIDHEFPQLIFGNTTNSLTSVTLYRGYFDDPSENFDVFWKGRARIPDIDRSVFKMNCESVFTSMSRPSLGRTYQRACGYALYSRGCNLDKDSSSFLYDGTVQAVEGLTLTIPEAASQADGFFTGGIITASDGINKYIRDHVGDQILITSAHVGFVADSQYSAVTLHPGCDRSRQTCEAKFNNLLNYGGQPWVPTKNPVGGSSVY